MKLIYQIGRLDPNFDRLLQFIIGDSFSCETSLSGYALKSYFHSLQMASALKLIFPVSLLFQKNVSEKRKDLTIARTIEEILKDPQGYLSNPHAYFKEHPHLPLAEDFEVIHSVGTYEGLSFLATLDHLVLEIFIKMWEDIFAGKDLSSSQLPPQDLEIYLDISGGHNIYNSALLEAGRFFLTILKLMLLHEREHLPKVFIAFSEPITNRVGPYHIYKDYELKALVFFSMPERPTQYTLKNAFSTNIVKPLFQAFAIEDSELKARINELLSRAYFFYSALKNNAPLVLYQWEYDDLSTIYETINKFVEAIKKKLREDYVKPIDFDLSLLRKFFPMLALYIGMINLFRKYGITKREAVSLSELSNTFADEKNSLYHLLGLSANIPYLRHELNRNFYYNLHSQASRGSTSEFSPLKIYFAKLQEASGESALSEKGEVEENLEKRNFFAHCGFERNITEVKGEGEQILLRYAESYANRRVSKIIEQYLLSS